jgi:hypothetical protein
MILLHLNLQVTYESCDWTADQMVAFLKGYRSQIGSTKVMAAESFQFRTGMTDPILVIFGLKKYFCLYSILIILYYKIMSPRMTPLPSPKLTSLAVISTAVDWPTTRWPRARANR